MFHTIEYRALKRNGFCSICGDGLCKAGEKVLVFTSIKGHMDTQHICDKCFEAMKKCYQTEETVKVY